MDPSIRTVGTFLNEDQRWLGNGGQPIGQPRSIVLDRAAFDLENVFPDGFIPSGVCLGKIEATGLYGPYRGDLTNEVVTIEVGGDGLESFTLTFDGDTTTSIDDEASATAVRDALAALDGIGVGNVAVTGPSGGPWVVTFIGALAATNVGAITATPTGGDGTVTPTVTQAGGAPLDAGGLEVGAGHLFASIPYDRNSTGNLSAALHWNGEVVEEFLPANSGIDEAFKADVPHISFI